MYNAYSKSYIVEPADGQGLNYNLIKKTPLKFYKQVLEQDVIKKSVFKEQSQPAVMPKIQTQAQT